MIAKVVLNTLTLMRVKIGKVDKKELKGGNIMHIHTMDENYDYRMRRLVEKFVQDYEIEEREPTALEDIIWKEYANGHYVSIVGKDFSKQVIDLRYDTSFDRNNKEKRIEHWAKTYWNGKDGAYSLESFEIIKLYTWDDIYDRADGKGYGDDELMAKDNARWNVRNLAINNGYPDLEETECPEDMVEFYCEEFDILFNEDGNIVEHSFEIEKE